MTRRPGRIPPEKKCRHPWCVKKAGHALPHKTKHGRKWTQMTCVNLECQGPCFEFPVLLQGHWTPCCRNIRWWNPDGTLGGSQDEPVFCSVCRQSVCSVQVEPILRKQASRPDVVHEHCRVDRWVALDARQWLYSAGRQIADMASTVATKGIEEGKTLKDVKRSFKKVIRFLNDRLDDPKLDMAQLASNVILGRTGKFGIPPFEKRRLFKEKAR